MAYRNWPRPHRNAAGMGLGAILALCTLLVAYSPALAATSVIPLNDSEISTYLKRLKLDEKQKPTVTAIMRRSRTEGESILKRYGINPQSGKKPGLFQMVTLKNEFNSVVSWARAEVKKVLTPVQLREFEKIYAEGKALLRQRLLK